MRPLAAYARAMLVLLIGLRGSGKSTLAPALGAAIGVPSIDLDQRVAQALDATSPGEALRGAGEPRFREEEIRQLGIAAESGAGVIALGGGTPEAPGSADLIRQLTRARGAKVVYLRATEATLRNRLKNATTDRPSLTGAGTLAEIGTLLSRRDPLYRSLAGLTLDVDTLTEGEAVASVKRWLFSGA